MSWPGTSGNYKARWIGYRTDRMPPATLGLWVGWDVAPMVRSLAIGIMALGHLRDDLLTDDLNGAQNVLLSLHHEANQHMGEP
jgi:hypothetical protein